MLLALWSWRTGEWADQVGGFADVFPNVNQVTRRKKRKAIYDELTRSGFTKQDISVKALKVVECVNSALLAQSELPDTEALVKMLMAELRVTIPSVDYSRAIHAAILARQEDDDIEVLLSFA